MKLREPHEHRLINSREWPGTRQLCVECGEPTERCEEDEILGPDGPICEACAGEFDGDAA